jgi:hypothetical protein
MTFSRRGPWIQVNTLRLIRAFEAIADEQIRQAIIEIVQTAARRSSIEQNEIEVS